MVTQTGHLLLGEQCLVLCSGLGKGLVGDADEARRLGVSLDDAFNALRAQWCAHRCEAYTGCTVSEKSPMVLTVEGEARLQTSRKQYVAYSGR